MGVVFRLSEEEREERMVDDAVAAVIFLLLSRALFVKGGDYLNYFAFSDNDCYNHIRMNYVPLHHIQFIN